ncbi:armadillo repeat-containing protein, partial [Reticulomyxa filosa]
TIQSTELSMIENNDPMQSGHPYTNNACNTRENNTEINNNNNNDNNNHNDNIIVINDNDDDNNDGDDDDNDEDHDDENENKNDKDNELMSETLKRQTYEPVIVDDNEPADELEKSILIQRLEEDNRTFKQRNQMLQQRLENMQMKFENK